MTPISKYTNEYLFANESTDILRVLLLEDLQTDAELIKLQLRKVDLEIEVKHTTNGKEFLDVFSSFKPHVIVSDYSLPQYTGMDAVKFVRTQSEFIPFIICTGSLNEETAVACIKAGADDYVLKDSLGRLPSAIMNALSAKTTLIEKANAIEDLAASEANFKAIAENAPGSIYKLDAEGTIIYVNRDIDQRPRHQIIGKSIFQFLDEENAGLLREAIRNCFGSGKGLKLDLKGNPDNPESKWYFCKLGPVLKAGVVESVVFIPTEITERVKAQEALKELNDKLHHLTQHLENIRDEEKKKIAMEIHDQLGQELTGNKLGLFWIRQELTKENTDEIQIDAILEKIEYLLDLTTQTIQTVRRIAHELRPVVLDDIGLIPALEWHIENYNKNHETQCELIVDTGDLHFSKDFCTAIYRMTQEALTNINRHANASKAWVSFVIDGEELKLEIKDNGVGIDKQKALKSKSLGLFGMRERIKNWDGTFEMNGKPQEGTTITVTFAKEKINT